MRKKQLPFILTAAMCFTPGMTVIGSESSGEALITDIEVAVEAELLGSSDVDEPTETEPVEPETPAPPATEEPETEEETQPASESEKQTEEPTEKQTETPTEQETEAETQPVTEPDEIQEEEIDEEISDEIADLVEEELDDVVEDYEEEETEVVTEEAELEYAAGGAVVSDGGSGELYVAVHGYPVGDLTQNEKDVYVYLRKELGLNKAAASGVLANVYFESNFSSVAIGDGGTSLGLCQWHLGRCKSLMSWCDAHKVDYRSVKGQLGYLGYELNNIYKDVYGYLLGVPDTAEGAYRAGYYFCMYYESPNDTKTRSEARGTMAKNSYYPSNLDKFLTADSSAAAKKGIKLSDRARLIVQIDKHS